jgi:hypothetical protein
MKFKLLFLSCILSVSTFSQTLIKGRVKDVVTNKPIENATLSLYNKGNASIRTYGMTNAKGEYQLQYTSSVDSLQVVVSGFNLKKQSKLIANVSQNLDFTVKSDEIVLQEVKIKPTKIRQSGDTLNYLVSAFSGMEDRTIGDVLKKMPGIQVQESGAILYQNQPINKFYIENLDMLQGRYGIATNNIEAKDIATVQVMENHQPIRSLEGQEFSNQAAINLKLKDNAKNTFFLNVKLGVELPGLFLSNELVGMIFGKGMQNMVVYKGDNTGRDITKELNPFYGTDKFQLTNILGILSPSPPSIAEQHYLFNDAHMVSVNDLRSRKEDETFITNVNYSYDQQEKNSYSESEYFFLENNSLLVKDQSESRLRKNRLNGDLLYTANKKAYYLSNKLVFNGKWDRENGQVFTDDSIIQHLKSPDYSISNTFDYNGTKNKNSIKVHSYIGLQDLSQDLMIRPLLYPDLFEEPSGEGMIQIVNTTRFYTENTISWRKCGIFSMGYEAGFKADIRDLESDLFYFPSLRITPDSMRNSLHWNCYEWIFNPGFSYDIAAGLRVSLDLPLRYVHLYKNNTIFLQKETKNKLYLDPFVWINWQITPLWSSMLMYTFSHDLGTINDAYQSYIMSSYRNLSRNDGIQSESKLHFANSFLMYRNPLSTVFGSLMVNYSNICANLLHDYTYQGILTQKTTIESPTTSQNLFVSTNIGKELESVISKVSVDVSYIYSSSSQLSQGETTDYDWNYVSVAPNISGKIGKLASLNYQIRAARSKSKVDISDIKLDAIYSVDQKLSVSLFPINKLQLKVLCEYIYNDAISSGSRSMWFGDLELKYKWKRIDITLNYTNVFNTKRYSLTSYSDVGKYYFAYKLRPTELLLSIRLKLI